MSAVEVPAGFGSADGSGDDTIVGAAMRQRSRTAGKQAGGRRLKSDSDRLISDVAAEISPGPALLVLQHGTTLAAAIREHRPDLPLTCFTTEHFFSRTLHEFHPDASQQTESTDGGIRIVCAADPPEEEFASILFPTLRGDPAEVAQEMFQTLHQRLQQGGLLYVSTNQLKCRWIETRLKALFSSVEVRKSARGILFIARRTGTLKKLRGFRARFGFRQLDRVLLCESRPGVFSHRRLDGGARSLIRSLDLTETVNEPPPQRIVEMGCGAGAVSVAAAARFHGCRVLGVDSDARAVECTLASAGLNDLADVSAMLSSTGEIPEPGSWDLVLGNPPYYSDFRIAEVFLQAARRALRPGGWVHIVSKPTEWHEARIRQLFDNYAAHEIGGYTVFRARQRKPSS